MKIRLKDSIYDIGHIFSRHTPTKTLKEFMQPIIRTDVITQITHSKPNISGDILKDKAGVSVMV